MANKLIHLSLCLSARYGARLIRAVGTMLLALMFVGITFAKGESQPRRVPALFASVNPRSRNRRAMGCYSPKAVAASFSPESVSVSTPHGPGSPVVFEIDQDPNDPAVLYVPLGNLGVYKSIDSGSTWSVLGATLQGQNISLLAIDPSNSNMVYGVGEGLFRTTDAGQTWSLVNDGPKARAVNQVEAMAVDPSASETIYLATLGAGVIKSTDGGRTLALANNGLSDFWMGGITACKSRGKTVLYLGADDGGFKSTDGGDHWSRIEGLYSGLDSGFDSGFYVYQILVHPADHNVMYAAGQGAYGSSALVRSTDGGTTWRSPLLIPPDLAGGLPYGLECIALNPTETGVLFAATDAGVSKSSDFGATWAPVNAGPPNLLVNWLGSNPNASNRLYAGTSGGVLTSTDSGSNWDAKNSGLPGGVAALVAVDPSNQNTQYAAAEPGGLYKTTDGGATWFTITQGLVQSDGYVADPFTIIVDPSNPLHIYLATDPGLFQSNDGGESWVGPDSQPPEVVSMVMDPTNPRVIYVGSTAGYIAKSQDSGATWQSYQVTANKKLDVAALAVDPVDPGILYAAMDDNSVYKSANGGLNWVKASPALVLPEYISVVTIIKVDPSNHERVFAAVLGRGLLMSTDGGNSWRFVNKGLPSKFANDIVIDSSGTVLVATGAGLVQSQTGKHWSSVASALDNHWVNSIVPGPPGSEMLTLGLDSGVARLTGLQF